MGSAESLGPLAPIALGVAVLGAVILVAWLRLRRARNRVAQLAAALALTRVADARHEWYAGTVRGHETLLTLCALTGPGLNSRPTTIPALRIVVAAPSAGDMDVVVYRKWNAPAEGLQSFATAFERKNEGSLPQATRDALLDFARRRPGGLRLRPRVDAHIDLAPAGTLAKAPYLLAHECRGTSASAAEIEAIVTELGAIGTSIAARR